MDSFTDSTAQTHWDARYKVPLHEVSTLKRIHLLYYRLSKNYILP